MRADSANLGRALLADGTTSLFDIYEATVLWDGALRRVAVDAADIDPLVGMCLLDGYELTVQVFEDRVTWVVSDTGYCLLYLVPSRAEEVTVGKRQVNWVLYKNVADTALSGVLTDAHGVVHPTSLPPGVASAAQVAHIHHRARQQFPGYVADAVCATPSPFIQAVFDLSIPHYRRGRLCLIWDASTLCRPHVPLNARARTAA
jgi:hypothetical protein